MPGKNAAVAVQKSVANIKLVPKRGWVRGRNLPPHEDAMPDDDTGRHEDDDVTTLTADGSDSMPDDDTFMRRLDDLSPTSDSPDLARNAIAPDEIGMSLGPRSKVQGGDADDDDADAEVRVPPTSDSPDLARNATTPNEISSFCTYAQCNYAQSIGMSRLMLPRSKVQGGDADDDDDADAEVRVPPTLIPYHQYGDAVPPVRGLGRPDWRPAVQRPGSKVQSPRWVQEVLMSYWSNQKKRRVCMPDDVDEVMTLDRSEPLPEVQGDAPCCVAGIGFSDCASRDPGRVMQL